MPIQQYYRGDSVDIKIIIKDDDGGLYDPDNVKVFIFDSKGNNMCTNQEEGDTASKVSTGEYVFYYGIEDDSNTGIWKVFIRSTNNSRITSNLSKFQVIEDI